MATTTVNITTNTLASTSEYSKNLNSKCYLWFWGCVLTQTLIAATALALLQLLCSAC